MILNGGEKNGAGLFAKDCLATWKASSLPFHVEVAYFFMNTKRPICRLVSLTDPSDQNIVSAIILDESSVG